MKTDLGRCKKLLDSGLSLLTVGENKVPNFPWKSKQTKPYTKDEFERDWNYAGGKLRKDETEIPATGGIGIITGYNNVEVLDIDLKILPSLKEQQDFMNEFLSFVKDNIDDFDKKFVIYKTVNNGYHIIYKCQTIEGNTKLASLKGHKEAIFETRGIGGYVFVYDNQVSKKSYTEIEEISILDRDMLLGICKVYDYKEQVEEIKQEPKKQVHEVELTVWDDYNARTSMMDVLGADFTIIRQLSDKFIIRRDGATSAHSGYIYKDSGCMFLFTTGTIYPNEKLVSPYAAYTIKYHNGDFSASAKELYHKGYGSRVVKKVKELERPVKIKIDTLQFPIDIFPTEIQNYIMACHDTLDNSIDYLGCSMLWMLSVIVGNSIKVQVKSGWIEQCTMWISVVGKAGIGKTPSISSVVFPIMKANNREIRNHNKEAEKFKAYNELDKEAKKNTEEIKKPRKTQFIANDITLEALVELHEENKNAVAVFKDELAGWLKDMNKYRAGSDMEFWLSTWSGKSVSLGRKTSSSNHVENPLISVLGGIQPGVLDSFYTEENKDNGFIDRMLLCFPDLIVEEYNDEELNPQYLTWYSDYIINFYNGVKNSIVQYDNENEIEPIIAHFCFDAKVEWKRIFNEITGYQNSDDENEYMKSMLPKQKSYIPRFALLINTLTCFHNHSSLTEFKTITKESMISAERLSKYFIAMAKKIKVNSAEINKIKQFVKVNHTLSAFEQFKVLYEKDPELNKKEVAELLNVSRTAIYDFIKKCKPV